MPSNVVKGWKGSSMHKQGPRCKQRTHLKGVKSCKQAYQKGIEYIPHPLQLNISTVPLNSAIAISYVRGNVLQFLKSPEPSPLLGTCPLSFLHLLPSLIHSSESLNELAADYISATFKTPPDPRRLDLPCGLLSWGIIPSSC